MVQPGFGPIAGADQVVEQACASFALAQDQLHSTAAGATFRPVTF